MHVNHFPKVFLFGKATYRPVGSLCYSLLYLALWFYSETLVPVTRSVESLAAGAAVRTSDVSGKKWGQR